MRRGAKPDFVLSENGEILGINLSSDHCAEHEHGFGSLKKELGVSAEAKVFGIERRRITVCSERLQWRKFSDGSEGFGLMSPYAWENKNKNLPPFQERYLGPKLYKTGPKKGQPKPGPGNYEAFGLAAAWDESEFLIRAQKEADIEKLQQVWDAIQSNDAAIWIAGGGPFGGHGLYIMIVSRIPEDYLQSMANADKEDHEIQEYTKSTGIEELLKAAGKRWYALSPRRFPNGLCKGADEPYTIAPGEVGWWLNPADQRNNHYGWYNLEQLQAWARNEGPIPQNRL